MDRGFVRFAPLSHVMMNKYFQGAVGEEDEEGEEIRATIEQKIFMLFMNFLVLSD